MLTIGHQKIVTLTYVQMIYLCDSLRNILSLTFGVVNNFKAKNQFSDINFFYMVTKARVSDKNYFIFNVHFRLLVKKRGFNNTLKVIGKQKKL